MVINVLIFFSWNRDGEMTRLILRVAFWAIIPNSTSCERSLRIGAVGGVGVLGGHAAIASDTIAIVSFGTQSEPFIVMYSVSPCELRITIVTFKYVPGVHIRPTTSIAWPR